MAIRKVYQALKFIQLSTYVVVNGQRTLIQFVGGTMQPLMNGKYTTEDPDLIEALDKSAGNGVNYKCISVENVKKGSSIPETQPDDIVDEDSEVTEVPGIESVQKAREYLLENFPDELKASQLPNGNVVKKVAAARNIKFVDLP